MVNVGGNRTVNLGATVRLQATATDADNDPLRYTWTLKAKPQGSSASISNANQANASFTADTEGDYSVEVAVSDGKVTARDSLTVTARQVANNQAPQLSAIADQRGFQSEAVTVSFTVSDEVPNTLQFRATSSDQSLVRNENIKVTGSGTSRQLTITPEFGVGSVTITLTVQDSQVSDSTSFTLAIIKAFKRQLSKLTANDAAAQDFFGYSVAMSGDYAIVGANHDDAKGTDSGSAYIFKRNGDTWSQGQKLTANDAATKNYFGASVAMSGDYAIVGARFDDDNGTRSGSAYIFQRSGTTWTQMKKLTASDAAAKDNFGISVAISGDYAVVGAFRDDHSGKSDAGSAYVFKRSGDNWAEVSKLLANDSAAGDIFGYSVAISGNSIIISAFHDDAGTNSGSAYIFERQGNNWAQVSKLRADDASAGNIFGFSVAISGDYVIAGAYLDDHSGKVNAGSAYIFKK